MSQYRKTLYSGVTFASIRELLFNMFFYYEEMTPEQALNSINEHVLPMQHNFENPLNKDGAKDTFIEFWIARDERLSQDYVDNGDGSGADSTYKVATIQLRFIGVEAEVWAKSFHHVTQRPIVAALVGNLCAGSMLEHIGDIIPVNVDYFGVGNSSIAFDLSLKIQYKESVVLNWKLLEYISLGDGEMISSGLAQ